MNDRMRRYLDEEWDEQQQEPEREREERREKKPLAQERRQKQKEWGRAHAKYWREIKKHGGHNKP